jgi:glycosyltransferase involved in cell wall biosynthesis
MSAPLERVLFIAPHFPEYTWRLAEAMGRICTTHLAVDRSQFDLEFDERQSVSESGAVTTKIAFESFLAVFSLIALILRMRPSIIHIQEPAGLKKSLICLIVVLLFSPCIKVALTVHDPQPHSGRDNATARRTWPYRRLIRKIAKIIFVHGDHCRQEYLNGIARSNQVVLSVNHGAILDDCRERRDMSRPLSALFFGRMEEYKGLDILLRAMRALRAQGEHVELTIAGAGPELDRLESDFKQLPNVEVWNQFVKPLHLMSLIKKSDCILMPYEGATQSGVLAAAMGNGRFVIASKVGGIPDIVREGENGLFMRPKDAESLGDCIRRVVREPGLRAKLLAGAELTGATILSWDLIAEQTFAGYRGASSEYSRLESEQARSD